jgi:hypothetical protein
MRLIKEPKFLMVQFAPGSAGKFLSSLLMSSDSLSHFDSTVENNKSVNTCVDYIKSHFTTDLGHWILTEPDHVMAWNLHFVSSKYTRGDDLTKEEFLNLANQHATDHFCNSVNANKIIPSVWHKTNTTDFLQDARFVTIIVDPPAVKWYHRAIWHKAYGTKNGKIHLKANDPELHPTMKAYYEKFKNPIYSDDSYYTFVKNNIINSEFKTRFQTTDSFTNHDQHTFVNLSELLDIESCVKIIDRVCTKCNLNPVPVEIIKQGHTHWMSCHNFKYAKNS